MLLTIVRVAIAFPRPAIGGHAHTRTDAYHAVMDRRAEQVSANEVAHRRLNERIEDSYESHSVESPMDVVCECGLEDCDVFLKVNKAEYEEVRADGRQFLIFAEHFNPGVDRVVSQGDRFTVVVKREGEPAEIARQTDPRQ
jgi:hypothetical protein